MTYRVRLKQSNEGWSVYVPDLPGCWSQGETEVDALRNIQEAISDYLTTVESEDLEWIERTVEVMTRAETAGR